MVYREAWAFQDETAVQLQAMGWQPESTSTSNTNRTSVTVYTYDGSPTRWSLTLGTLREIVPPAQFQPNANIGCWSIPILLTDPRINAEIMRMDGISPDTSNISVRVVTVNTLGLFIDNVLRDTSQTMDLTIWHYLTMKGDMRAATWEAEMWVDNVQEGTASVLQQIQVSSQFLIQSGSEGAASAGMFVGGLAFFDDFADPSQVPMFCTNKDGNADVAESGTWVATGGDANNFSQLGSPLDTATNTTEATPVATDRVDIGIAAGGDDISTALGITPGTIAGISVHTFSTGESINARAVISVAGSDTDGITVAIDESNTTYASVGTDTNPDTASAWVGTDQPVMGYEVVA